MFELIIKWYFSCTHNYFSPQPILWPTIVGTYYVCVILTPFHYSFIRFLKVLIITSHCYLLINSGRDVRVVPVYPFALLTQYIIIKSTTIVYYDNNVLNSVCESGGN